jgi:hypothetical protein
MVEWDTAQLIGSRNDDAFKVFSLRQDFLGLGNDQKALARFKQYLGEEAQVLEAGHAENEMSVRALKLSFSTAREKSLFFRRERWLEKINFMKVKVLNSGAGGRDSMIDGFLKYGGTSFIRNRRPGAVDPQHPDRLIGEMTGYPVRHWEYDPVGGWISEDGYGSYISIHVADNPDVLDSVYKIETFKELSVAASEWTLYIGLEEPDGTPIVDPARITDILIQFHFYWYNRPLN